eukprot:XP_028345081.1 guanine nucleotide-binding protein G(I)/G(S)/G(O) subunit gamma-12 isoform X2 [Physeter catodon]
MAGDAAPGTRAGAVGEVSQLARLLPGLPAAVRPAPGWGWEAPAFPARACGGARFGRRADNWGDRGATPLFPTFFRSFWGLSGVCADLEPARRWGSGGEIAGHSEDSDHTSREGPPNNSFHHLKPGNVGHTESY